MFIKAGKGGYNRGGEQYSHGYFLWIVQQPGPTGLRPELRALVRHVRMRQLGHWMMAGLNVGGYRLCLSGAYGGDGLPDDLRQHFVPDPTGEKKSVPAYFTPEQAQQLFDQLVPIPQDLQDAFWAGGGHNTSGSEGPLFRKWANENFKLLRKRIPILTPVKVATKEG